MSIPFHAIGTIHSPFRKPEDMPIQPSAAAEAAGTVVVKAEFQQGLKDLDGFSHLILLYHFHLTKDVRLRVKPFLDEEPRGVFATRAPCRPNPVGLSIVRLDRVEGRVLHIGHVDVVDGTPLLDIKPYVPTFDRPEGVRVGWLSDKLDQARTKRADDRFQQ